MAENEAENQNMMYIGSFFFFKVTQPKVPFAYVSEWTEHMSNEINKVRF